MFPDLTGGLSSIISAVPLPGKMTIIPIKNTAPIPTPAGPPYVIMFNPETLTESLFQKHNDEQPEGPNKKEQHYSKTRTDLLNFEFLIDGTGAGGDKREVKAEVELFKAILQISSDTHRPPFLLIVYGTYIKTVVLSSLTVQYTMFRKNGTPLRAKLNASFKEHVQNEKSTKEANLKSPDITKKIIQKEGQTLPLLSNSAYDSPRLYLEIARANKLTNFRKINPGREMIFPPVGK